MTGIGVSHIGYDSGHHIYGFQPRPTSDWILKTRIKQRQDVNALSQPICEAHCNSHWLQRWIVRTCVCKNICIRTLNLYENVCMLLYEGNSHIRHHSHKLVIEREIGRVKCKRGSKGEPILISLNFSDSQFDIQGYRPLLQPYTSVFIGVYRPGL